MGSTRMDSANISKNGIPSICSGKRLMENNMYLMLFSTCVLRMALKNNSVIHVCSHE